MKKYTKTIKACEQIAFAILYTILGAVWTLAIIFYLL